MNRSFDHFRKPTLIMAGIGATLGLLLDGLHSHFGATTYMNPIFAKAAWWALPVFIFAYVAGIARPLLDEKPIMPDWKPALGMGLFITAYALTVAPLDVSTRVALLIGLFATGFFFCDPSRACLIVSVVGAFSGPFVESMLVRANLFVHHEAFFFGVPIWLPFLYLNAGVGLGTLSLWLVQHNDVPHVPTPENVSRKDKPRSLRVSTKG